MRPETPPSPLSWVPFALASLKTTPPTTPCWTNPSSSVLMPLDASVKTAGLPLPGGHDTPTVGDGAVARHDPGVGVDRADLVRRPDGDVREAERPVDRRLTVAIATELPLG